MSYLEYLLLISSVLLGGGVALYIKKDQPNLLQMVLAFSGAYLLGIVCIHLLPEVFHSSDKYVGIFILIGFFIQLMLEHLSQGIEHGHIHTNAHSSSFAWSIMIGLCIHAFIEGIPLEIYNDFHAGHNHANHLLYGIVLHKIPAAFALSLVLINSNYSRKWVFISIIIFAIMSPMGAFFAGILKQTEWMNPKFFHYITAIVIGSFTHISTTILFESDKSKHHHIPLKKLVVIILGFLLAIMTMH